MPDNKKFYATIEVVIIVNQDNYDSYDDVRCAAILQAQEISSKVPNSSVISVEATNGLLTTEIYKK